MHMPRLSQQQIDQLTQLMNERLAREFTEIRSLLAGMGELRQRTTLDERAADTLDEALLHSLSATDEALIRQSVRDVRDMVAARQRIAAGTYGECSVCGGDIRYERLLVGKALHRLPARARATEGPERRAPHLEEQARVPK
jgi:RNA polymerase-binding transcription factor DksA